LSLPKKSNPSKHEAISSDLDGTLIFDKTFHGFVTV
jgi:hypothetical protein